MFELKQLDNNTIEIDAKEIKDDKIYELDKIKETLDTYNIESISFEYDYVPYYMIGCSRNIKYSFNLTHIKTYDQLLKRLKEDSIADRRSGWSNEIKYLKIKCRLKKEKSLDFIKGQVYSLIENTSIHNDYDKGYVDGLQKIYNLMEK